MAPSRRTILRGTAGFVLGGLVGAAVAWWCGAFRAQAVRPAGGTLIRVVDGRGRAVEGADTSVVRPPRNPSSGGPNLARAWTNSSGVAGLAAVPPGGPFTLRVAPPEGSGLGRLEVRDWRAQDTTVVLPPGFVVRGRVVDAAGDPLLTGRVIFRMDGSLFEEAASIRPDGTFQIDRLPAGAFLLRAGVGETDGQDVRVSLPEAADRPIPLRVEVTPARIRIRGWSPALRGTAYLREPRSASLWLPRDRPIPKGGVVDVTGVNLASIYTFWVAPKDLGSRECVYVEGLRLSPGENVVDVTTGQSVGGRLVFAADADVRDTDLRLYRPAVRIHIPVGKDRRFLARCVPAGEWTLYADIYAGRRSFRAKMPVSTGSETLEVVLSEQ